MSTRPQKDAHRFFNAMVLMGGSLALGCGGATADGEGTGGSGSQGSGAGGTGGGSESKSTASGGSSGLPSAQGSGGVPSTMGSGGIPSSGTGGVVATGGAPMIATGGAAGSPEKPTFVVTACQPSQWVCPVPDCAYDGEGVRVPAGCRCDPTLPVDVVCGPSERLACLHGTQDANQVPIAEVDFSCRCVPAATACDACPRIFGASSHLSCDESRFETGQIICGCAVVYLR